MTGGPGLVTVGWESWPRAMPVDIGLAVGAASVTVCGGAFGSYRLSRWRAAVAEWEASRLRGQ